VALVLSAHLHFSNKLETWRRETVVLHGRGSYENNGEDSTWQGGLDNHKDDSIIHARIILANGLLQLVSDGEQSMRHENGINHSEARLDAEVGKLRVDTFKKGTGTRLYLNDNRQCYLRCQ